MDKLSQNTNLASEYYVFSVIYRMGPNVMLTPGNKKSRIRIEKDSKAITVGVEVFIKDCQTNYCLCLQCGN